MPFGEFLGFASDLMHDVLSGKDVLNETSGLAEPHEHVVDVT